MSEILQTDKLAGCRALRLAVEGWSELLRLGHASDNVVLSWNQSAIWLEEEGEPVAVMVWELQDAYKELWISLSYVKPEFRSKGYFRRLYSRVVEIAKAKNAIRIAGAISIRNTAMQQSAVRCGRHAEYIVYVQPI